MSPIGFKESPELWSPELFSLSEARAKLFARLRSLLTGRPPMFSLKLAYRSVSDAMRGPF
jgi:hypothetical protein